MASVAFSYSYEFDEDEDYCETAIIKEYKKQLKTRNVVDAILINTRYLDRLTPEQLKEVGACATITGESQITLLTELNEELFNAVRTLEEADGSLVFKNTNAIDAVKLISTLNRFDYCAFCLVSAIQQLIWYKIGNFTVLYIELDTESG